MISVAVSGNPRGNSRFHSSAETVDIGGAPVTIGLVQTPGPAFDREAPENASMVAVRVKAFSCNYRDQFIIRQLLQEAPAGIYHPIGSEFVAEVVDVGSGVTRLRPGDRVIGNNQYPDSGVDGVPPGIATNYASRRYLVLHETKLVKVPPEMPTEVAAAFSVGAQTAYSIVRKLELSETEASNVLVTAAKSNTALFAISALRKHRVNVYATSSSRAFEEELRDMGVRSLNLIDPDLQRLSGNERSGLLSEVAGFDYVVDPFSDIHLGKILDVMKPGSKYITCGLLAQNPSARGEGPRFLGRGLREIVVEAIVKNISLIGNCLGQRADLQNALKDYSSGSFDVVIDSVFTGNQVGAFVDRTYNDKERFGKVVYRYDDAE
ncbi:MAG: zinc-binding alcohol dehydrogenase family protein [Rubrobacteraceae bacterium]